MGARSGMVSLAVVAAAAAMPASAEASHHCGDVRVDRFLKPKPKGDFGAFDITRSGTSCQTARRIASRYVRDPRAVLRAKRIEGFVCTKRNLDSQLVWVTCVRSKPFARILFPNWLPSG